MLRNVFGGGEYDEGVKDRVKVSAVWRKTAALLIAGLGICSGFGAGAAAFAGEQNRPGLWHVTGPNGSLDVLGSIHILAEDDIWLDPPTEAAFAGSDCLALEIDLAAIGREVIAARLRAAARYDPRSGGLRDHISDKTYRRFLGMASDLALSPESLDQFQPWLVGMILSEVAARSLGYDDEYGVDYALTTRAKALGKPVVGLESLKDQIVALSASGGESDDQLMREALDGLERQPRLTKRVAAAWRRGDMKTIDRMVTEEFADRPDDYDRLIGRRNRAWMPHLEKMLSTGRRCMVVVGAGHLVGEASLLVLLEDAGYTVTRE